MMNKPFNNAELVCREDGSVYHLALHPGELAEKIILVGDPERVGLVSAQFDNIELKRQEREFITHTGWYKGERFSVISTGIGTDNVDIVINELDALFNVDFKKREPKSELTSLILVRVGTCGALQAAIPVDDFIVSSSGIGFDGLLHCYDVTYNEHEKLLTQAVMQHCQGFANQRLLPYVCDGDKGLIKAFSTNCHVGLTVTCTGFYGPQGRQIRLKPQMADFLDVISRFHFQEEYTANFEMETSGLYGLGRALGHRCLSLSRVVVNRITGESHRSSVQPMGDLIALTLDTLCKL
ncbi:MAG: phosphorylase [Gammaproteobacteria bacterium]|jgi:uridine phosphorylase|nr:phosphorylase [Gammaproteobacteria bacterium]